MKHMIRWLCIMFALIVLFTCAFSAPVGALSFECDVEQYSDTLLMINLDTDMEVYAKEADTKRYE